MAKKSKKAAPVESAHIEEQSSDEVTSVTSEPTSAEAEDVIEADIPAPKKADAKAKTSKLIKFIVRKGYAYYPVDSAKVVVEGETVELSDITVGDQKWKLEEV
tara:strand:- start:6370 stop:6678 length:309 start_codon:yes stop_codon:yes gene_type:complete